MFNKNKIVDLERRLDSAEGKLEIAKIALKNLEDRVWKLENPPKFKVGDAIKDSIIVKCTFINSKCLNKMNPFYDSFIGWKYSIYHPKMGLEENVKEQDSISNKK